MTALSPYAINAGTTLRLLESNPGEWDICKVNGFDHKLKGTSKYMVPVFDIPEGYKTAPSRYHLNDGTCDLCDHPIIYVYWLRNDAKKVVMPVGSDCVTNYMGVAWPHELKASFKRLAAMRLTDEELELVNEKIAAGMDALTAHKAAKLAIKRIKAEKAKAEAVGAAMVKFLEDHPDAGAYLNSLPKENSFAANCRKAVIGKWITARMIAALDRGAKKTKAAATRKPSGEAPAKGDKIEVTGKCVNAWTERTDFGTEVRMTLSVDLPDGKSIRIRVKMSHDYLYKHLTSSVLPMDTMAPRLGCSMEAAADTLKGKSFKVAGKVGWSKGDLAVIGGRKTVEVAA